jgi:hypothetical protein
LDKEPRQPAGFVRIFFGAQFYGRAGGQTTICTVDADILAEGLGSTFSRLLCIHPKVIPHTDQFEIEAVIFSPLLVDTSLRQYHDIEENM